MLKFHILRSGRDWIGHLILIFLPILLITFLTEAGVGIDMNQTSSMLTIGIALTFQIYGSALSFETLGKDFFTPINDRLLSTPVNPRKIVMSVLFSAILVSFLQTLVIVLFSTIILGAEFNNILLILAILLLSVVFNQLFGTVILFFVKKVNTATAITSLYGTIAPIAAGVYFPLPDNKIFDYIKDYLTPMSLAQTAIKGIMNQDIKNILFGVALLIIPTMILFILIKPLSKKVIV